LTNDQLKGGVSESDFLWKL